MKYKDLAYLLLCNLVVLAGCVRIDRDSFWEFHSVVAPRRDIESLDRLIERAGHIDARDTFGRTFLYMSALQGYKEFVEYLVQKGAKPIRGKNGKSALHAAAQEGHCEIVDYLVAAGVNVDIRCTEMGITPLMSAARNVRSDSVALLLERGADPLVQDRFRNNVFDGMGETFPSRMDASTFNDNVERSITLLAKAGADINHESRSRRTPLMQMCAIGSEIGVRTLLKFGADPRAENRNGQSVLDFADGDEALTRLIKEAIRSAGTD